MRTCSLPSLCLISFASTGVKMRLELAGSIAVLDPLILTYTANGAFIPQTYIDQGYKYFDVIVIGGGGGAGGGIDTNNTGTLVRSYGGAGGGGGLQRVRGLLKYLSASVAVTVGAGGTGGTNHASAPASTVRGGDGGASSFGTTAKASGGKGGGNVVTNSLTGDPQGWGGDGGIGNSLTAGGGARGGRTATGNSTSVPKGADGLDGPYVNGIGQGGGGGGGGMAKYDGTLYLLGSAGGRGSYNLTDTSVFGPGSAQGVGIVTGVVPGGGGGAKASPVNGLPTVYGQAVTTPSGVSAPAAGIPGIVVVRLTAE